MLLLGVGLGWFALVRALPVDALQAGRSVMRTLPLLTCLFMLPFADIAGARPVRNWTYLELMEEADLVVIADASAHTDVENTDGFLPNHLVQIETKLRIHAVVKCGVDDERILRAMSARDKGREWARKLRRQLAEYEDATRGLVTSFDPFSTKPQKNVEPLELDESQKARLVASKTVAEKHIQRAWESIADGEWKKRLDEALEDKDIASQFRILEGFLERPVLDIEIEFVHFRYKDDVDRIGNGPWLIRFRTEGPVTGRRLLPFSKPVRGSKPKYLLFLKRRDDGKYEAVSGQEDPVDSVKRLAECDVQW